MKILYAGICSLGVLFACQNIGAAADLEQSPTVAGVRAVEVHWQNAFTHGDGAYLQRLLTDDYVSISANGVARDRAVIIRLARAYAYGHPGAQLATTLSPDISVKIQGNAAIVTSMAMKSRSVDVFYYANGAWRAWYSQHTNIRS